MNNMSIEVSCGYRIHINSIDMNGFNNRTCGGIGFCVEEPRVKIIVTLNPEIDYIPRDFKKLIFPLLEKFRKCENVNNFYHILLASPIYSHKGLGSTTIIKLCILSALYKLEGKILTKSLANLFEIGFISGISINAFFFGGFIADGGYQNNVSEKTLNGVSWGKPAPLIFQSFFPEEWFIFLAVPKTFQSLTGEKEKDFFNQITPIKNSEVYEISYNVLMGTLPSLLEKELELFSKSLKNIIRLGTKKHEKKLHMKENKLLLDQMESDFGFSSVTSLGPSVYTITNKYIDIKMYQDNFKEYIFFLTKVSNTGHRIEFIHNNI